MLRGAVGRGDAEDCFQETFLAALRAYPRLGDDEQPARLAADDRPPQGDRPPPRERAAAAAGGRVAEVAVEDPGPAATGSGSGRRAAAEAARGGHPALRLRPPPRRDRRGARLLARGRAAQPARGNEATEEGAGMNRPAATSLAERAAEEGLSTSPTHGRLALRAAADRADAARAGPGRPAQLGHRGDAGGAGGARLAARAGGAGRARRGPARARPLLRGQADRVRPAARLAAQPRLPRGVQRAIDRIPYGQTRTYMEDATSAGNERAVRAAGTGLRLQPDPDRRPLSPGAPHRRGARRLRRGTPMKRALLELEASAS